VTFTITCADPRLNFAAAHFIVDHEKCGRLHGHNYFLSVTVEGSLDEQGMVLDYGILKKTIKAMLDPLDHHVLVPKQAKDLVIHETENEVELRTKNKRLLLPKEEVIFLPLPSTTSELLAKYFHDKIAHRWPEYRFSITIEEAPGASATYSQI
jgi:6-pyruvoyltetrahydropterin/6-carboxytetrahydropterin synthase